MWYVSRARANNETKVQLPPIIELEAEIGDLNSVAERSSIVIADLIEQCTSFDTYHVYTWYKYKLIDRLGHNNVIGARTPGDIPGCLGSVGQDQFVLAEPYGTVQIDGVTVSRTAPLDAASLPRNEQRLMFVRFIGDGSRALLPFGNKGLFSVSTKGHIRSINDRVQNPLSLDIEQRCHGSVSQLRELVQ